MRNIIPIFILVLIPFLVDAQDYHELVSDAKNLAKSGQIDLALAKVGKLKNEAPLFHSTMGEIYLLYGKTDQSMIHLDSCLTLLAQSKNSSTYVYALSNKAILYWNQGKNNQALDLLIQANELIKKTKNIDLLLSADIQNNLGLVYSGFNESQAKIHYANALERYKQIENQEEKVAQTIINMAIVEQKEKAYKNALTNFKQALDIISNKYGEQHSTAAFILSNIGQTHALMGDIELSAYFLDQALLIYQKIYGDKHPEIANLYSLKGDLALQKYQYKDALENYQKALIANSFQFESMELDQHPSSNDILKSQNMVFILHRKANALKQFYSGHSLKNEHLRIALNSLWLADSIINTNRHSTYNKQDQLALSEISTQVYELGQTIALLLSKGTIKKGYYEAIAFSFSEKNKSANLISAIQESEAKNFAGIPDELLAQEERLNKEIAYYELYVADAASLEEQNRLRNQLSLLKQEHAALLEDMEVKYPEYYALKNSSQLLSKEAIQERITENERIISYNFIESENQVYAYVISSKKLSVYKLDNLIDIRRNSRGLRNALRYKLKNEYVALASTLYEQLFPFGLDNKADRLYIIAEGELNKIPFEALITKRNEANDFESYAYLINSHEVSYNFSVNILLMEKNMEQPSENALLFAPISFRNQISLSNLPASEREINEVSASFAVANRGSLRLSQSNANKKDLLNHNLADYGYIHLATHGKVDEVQPELSRLYTANAQDILYANEIYNWSLNARLVCLSACETGLGKLTKSEGLIGLGRAFSFAGAENIIVSLWTVADESTASLMAHFYDYHINKNQSMNAALRSAKLDLIKQRQTSLPYYWSPFILLGQGE